MVNKVTVGTQLPPSPFSALAFENEDLCSFDMNIIVAVCLQSLYVCSAVWEQNLLYMGA